MQYGQVIKASFIERPNRFIAYCEVEGEAQKVHVKNTGRCKELLLPGVTVYLETHDDPRRKTKYSLITVEKGKHLINMDSQAPNQVVEEALKSGQIYLSGIKGTICYIKREQTYGNSRFDFYLETSLGEKIFIEVKGVTLEAEGKVMFPDAKTERGTKHLHELISAQDEGYKCYVLFVIQMQEVDYFTPHKERDPVFAAALKKAFTEGVGVLAYNCLVTPDTLAIDQKIEVRL